VRRGGRGFRVGPEPVANPLFERTKTGVVLREIPSPKIIGGDIVKLPHRRQFLRLAVGAAALPVISRTARAQTYPTRPVRLIVGFAPGGVTDIVARIMGQWLSERLGQQLVIENRAGGGSNIAAQAVINAPADGYTLLLVTGSNAVNATFYDSLPFNFLKDIAPVAGLVRYPLLMVVNPSVPATSVAQFVAFAKANPDRISMASAGIGTTNHLAGELFKTMTGVKMVHVPYRGLAPAITDVIAGQVQMMFATPPESIGHIKSGKLRLLAVSTSTRWEQFADIPTVGETVPGYEASSWSGIGGPRGAPPEIIEKLAREINAGLANPSIKARLAEVGTTPMISGPSDFGQLIADETEKWGKVVKLSDAKPE
jgi:tripartite-type tricarboxylate transporter receptor subunit TctC